MNIDSLTRIVLRDNSNIPFSIPKATELWARSISNLSTYISSLGETITREVKSRAAQGYFSMELEIRKEALGEVKRRLRKAKYRVKVEKNKSSKSGVIITIGW